MAEVRISVPKAMSYFVEIERGKKKRIQIFSFCGCMRENRQ